MLTKTLLPRGILVAETYNKLTGFFADIQAVWQGELDLIANAYDLDKLDEDGLRKFMASFDLLDLYSSLPGYYHGSATNDDGVPYISLGTAPLDKLTFMRDFTREMLKLRNKAGLVKIVDPIMGLLGVPVGKFTVIQNFRYGSSLEPVPKKTTTGTRTDISFNHLIPDKISRVSGSFVTDGFYSGQQISVSGSVSNDGAYTIQSVTPNDITLVNTDTLIDESAGAHVTVTNYADFILDRVIYSSAHILGLFEPAPCYRKYGPVNGMHGSIPDSSFPGFVDEDPYDPIPSQEEAFFPDSIGRRMTPTQTITVEVLSIIPAGISSEFIKSVRLLINFVKPSWVVFKDITPAVYLYTNQLYQMSMSLKGQYVEPQQLAPDYRIDFQDMVSGVSVDGVNNKFIFAVNPVEVGFRPGMLVTTTLFSNIANNVKLAQIVAVGTNYIKLNTADATLVTETSSFVAKIHADYDHSFQDALVAGADPIDYDMAPPDLTLPKPFIEERSETIHVSIHQPGPLPTVDTGGSYNAMHATERLDMLDHTHYDNLGSRVGGMVWFGDAWPPSVGGDDLIITEGLGGNLLVTEGMGDS